MGVKVGEVEYEVRMDKSRIDHDAAEANATIDSKMNSMMGTLNKSFGWQLLKDIGGAFLEAGKAAANFAKECIQTGMTFDSSMSQVAATMGVTVDEIGELRDFAKEMGATTAFSATQAADALNYMALAGYDAETSMKMLPNVLNLAAAGGIELARASDMVTDAASALGLSIEETTEMVDIMAVTSSKSNTSVAQLGDAILTVGGTAKMLRGGTVELAEALGILADNGTKGAEGGTHLRNIILSLTSPTDTAAKRLEALGIAVFDANGEMNSLQSIMAQLNGAMSKMTDAQRVDAISAIFNKADIKDVNALLDTSVDRWMELGEAINTPGYSLKDLDAAVKSSAINWEKYLGGAWANIGDLSVSMFDEIAWNLKNTEATAEELQDYLIFDYELDPEDALIAISEVQAALENASSEAAVMAETQLDNLQGSITLFQSAWEGVQIAISDELTPALREFVDYASEAASGLTEAIGDGGLAGGFDYVGQVVGDLAQKFMEEAPKLLESGAEMLRNIGQGLVQSVPEFLGHALPLIMEFTGNLRQNFGKLVDAGIDLLKNLVRGLIAAMPTIIQTVPQIIINICGLINDNMPKILKAGLDIIVMLAKGLIQNLPVILANLGKIVEAIFAMMAAQNWLDIGKKIIQAVGNGLKALMNAPLDVIKSLIAKIKEFFLGGGWHNLGSDILKGIANGIKNGLGILVDAAKGVVKGALGAVKSFLGIGSPSKVFRDQVGEPIAQGVAVGVDNGTETAEASVIEMSRKLVEDFSVSYSFPDIGGYARELGASITASTRASLEVPVYLDGREIARGTAVYTDQQLAWEAQ